MKQRLINGEIVLGSFLGFPSPVIVDMMAAAGYGFVILDSEHGNFSNAELEACTRAAAAAKLPCLIRIPCSDPVTIQKVLDLGADGFMVSMVNNAESAAMICRSALFPPKGTRGFSTHTIAGSFGNKSTAEFFEDAATNKILCVQIETKEGLENLNSILAVEDVDMIFVGAADLLVSCGFQSFTDKEAVDAYSHIAKKTIEAGKIPGIVIIEEDMVSMSKNIGYRFLASTVIGTINEAFVEYINKFN